MKKIVLSFLMITLSIGFIFGQSVSQNEAENIARNFFVNSSYTTMQKVPAYVDLKLVYEKIDKEQPTNKLFYVYNIEGENGFVIVSADKRTKSILGYSDKGKFDAKNIPISMSAWLDYYGSEIKYAKKNLREVSDKDFSTSISRAPKRTTSVQPLLGTINFDQDAPYNDQCPEKDGERTVTGCVATAIAQVMKYHNWPNVGSGSRSYNWKRNDTDSVDLSVDFSAQTYDWTKIKPFYNGNATDDEKAEVAKLMYHVGVSVNMNYDLSANGGSGTYTPYAVNSLFEYFDYDAGIQCYYKDFFTIEQWNQKIKEELDNNRPVIYSGQGSGGGHAFVCDGYDETGKFHINWGWGGFSNGYFETTALNPNGLGIGGGSGGFNTYQSIITGIQKSKLNSQKTQLIGISGFNNIPIQVNRGDTFLLTVNDLFNIGGFTYRNGAIQLTLEQNDVFVQNFKYYPINEIKSGWGASTINFDDLSILSSVDNGNYQIVLRYKNEDGDMVPVLTKQNGVKVVNVQVTDTTLIFSSSRPAHNVSLVEKLVSVTKLYHNRIGHIKIKLANSGDNDYNAQIGLKLVNKSDSTITQELYHSSVGIPIGTVGKQISALGKIDVPAGDYYLQVYYDNYNDINNTGFPITLLTPNEHNTIEVSVLEEPTEEPNLSIANISMPDTVMIGRDFDFTVDITNSGGMYNDDIVAVIFFGSPLKYKSQFGKQKLIIDKNETTAVTLQGNITNLPEEDYVVALYSYDGQWNRISKGQKFTLIKNPTDLTHIKKEDLSVVVKENALWVKLPENNLSVRLFDVSGQLVYQKEGLGELVEIPTTNLTSGIFILQVLDKKNNSFVRKIILTK